MDNVVNSHLYFVFTINQTAGLAILSTSFLCFGYAAQRKIWRTFSPSSSSGGASEWSTDANFRNGLIRLNVIIIVCFICFTLKAACTYYLITDSTPDLDNSPLIGYGIGITGWTALYEWVPDIVPRLALLYLMSRNLTSDSDGQFEYEADNRGKNSSGVYDGIRRSGETFSDDRPFLGRSFQNSRSSVDDGFTNSFKNVFDKIRMEETREETGDKDSSGTGATEEISSGSEAGDEVGGSDGIQRTVRSLDNEAVEKRNDLRVKLLDENV